MGNLPSFFSRKNFQENNAVHSGLEKPVFFKYYLGQQELSQIPKILGYINAVDIIVEIVQKNRFSGDETRLIAGAKTLSLFLFEGLKEHFTDPNEIFYISEEYSSQFILLLLQQKCISNEVFVSKDKADLAITLLLSAIPQERISGDLNSIYGSPQQESLPSL